jgi:tetratricopeptide (TPR) repeat protein
MSTSAVSSGSSYDVFISYAHADFAAVTTLVSALKASDLRVWFDESEIETFASISERIASGLAQSKAFLAYYSKLYPARRPCQYELTAAFVAAQAADRGLERLLVVNPEAADSHIQPIELRDRKFLSASLTPEQLAAGAAAVCAHLATISGALGEPMVLAPPQWYPRRGTGSTRFVGRIDQMWMVHSSLNDDKAPFAAKRDSAGIAQIAGLGGVGKSLLVEEYALRFGVSYPAGVFWLRALGSEAAGNLDLTRVEASRIDQLSIIATQLNLPAADTPAELDARLRDHFQKQGQRGLWVVDDVPAGLPVDQLRSWFAPHPLLKTLLTTRSREYRALAALIDLGALVEDDAYSLLISQVKPNGVAEESAARLTVQALGGHALAVDVAGAAMANYEGAIPFQDFLRELESPDQDSLELAADLSDALPNGHDRSIAATLLGAIRSASESARDVLRIASLLEAAPIAELWLIIIPAFSQDGLDEEQASRAFRLAARDLQRFALAEKQEGGSWLIHPLIARAVRFAYGKDPRTEDLRRQAIVLFYRWLSDRRARDLPVAAELAHARKLAAAGRGQQELNLFQLVATQDEMRGSYQMAAAEWRAILSRLEALPHTELATLAMQSNLAITLRKAGNTKEARDLQMNILTRRTELLGPKDPETITVLDNLGVTLSDLGDYAGAVSKHQSAVRLYSEVLGPEHPDTLVAMANLATALRLDGKLREAFQLNTDLLKLRVKVFGPKHPRTLRTLEALGVTLSDLGQPAEALPLLRSAALALASVVGPDDPTTLSVRYNMAKALIETGQLNEGRAIAEEVLETQERVVGIAHSDTLSTLDTVVFAGVPYGHLEPNPKFELKAMEALKELSSSVGPRNPRTTWCAWMLYLMWEGDPKRRSEAVDLVDKYLAWLLTARSQDLEPPQPTIQGQFARTGDGLFRTAASRLFPAQERGEGEMRPASGLGEIQSNKSSGN